MSYAAHPTPSPDTEAWTRDDWNTPEWVLAPIRQFAGGQVGFDPCHNSGSLVGAAQVATIEDDSLTVDWDGLGLVFVNPPYSRGAYLAFARKIREQGERGVEVVALVPTNCETEAWTHFWRADAICFLGKRVRFLRDGREVGSPAGGSALVYFGDRPRIFDEVHHHLGEVVFPGLKPGDGS